MATSSETTSFGQMPKLQNISDNAEVPVLVNGNNYTTTVSAFVRRVTKTSVGLGKVQNLAPDEMPVSTAVRDELLGKVGVDDQLPISQITNLQQALDDKINFNQSISQSQIENLTQDLDTALNGLVDVGRIDGLVSAIGGVIDERESTNPPVVQGVHVW